MNAKNMNRKILLIQPSSDRHFNKIFAKLFLIPSLSLEQVAACTPPEYEVKIIDESYEEIDWDGNYNLIGITSFTKDAFRAYEIADEFRNYGKKVVLGGIHPTLLPNEAKRHADSVVIGEAEESWPTLLKDFEKGELRPFYEWKRKVPPEKIPPAKRYNKLIAGAVQASRGCPYRCNFCQLTGLNDTIHRKRPIEDVIYEIKNMDERILWFQDASLTINPKYTKKLFRKMIEERLNKKWIAFGNAIVLGKDDELLKLAKKSGCMAWMVGFETVSKKDIRKNKGIDFYKVVEKVGKYGMGVWASFIFGFDEDKPETFDYTYDEISSWGIESAEFNILTPLPKTPLFEKLEREGRILTKDWSKYNFDNVVFKPKNMTPMELKHGVEKISRKFYSISAILKRIIKVKNKSKNPLSFLFRISTNFDLRIFHKMRFTPSVNK